MTTSSSSYVAGLLKRTGLLSDEQIDGLVGMARLSGMSITELVHKEGLVAEGDFLQALAEVMRLSYVRADGLTIEPELRDSLPAKVAFEDNVLPVSLENGTLVVATSDPLKPGLGGKIRLASGARVRFALATADDIAKATKKYYGVGAETVDRMMEDGRFEIDADAGPAKVEVGELGQEASIVSFVNQIISEAKRQQATDIHFEPHESDLRIRYRIDGVLRNADVPKQLQRFQAAIISRIKVMANLDIAEKRLPMDGRIGLRVDNEPLDIRVSTMPTVYGESVSLRLLQQQGEFIGLPELGLGERDVELTKRIIHRPNGIVLVTGPTGSGKSTTLYAFLHEVNDPSVRILTAEEPIEYEMPGINQVLIRESIGLTYSEVLRTFLRQDPDIIMIGEVRDLPTARIAIQASLTGHLVFSTLHTNDAASAFTRLLDMGVEAYLLASAVEAAIAQRLMRHLCPVCRTEQVPDPGSLAELEFPMDQLASGTIYEAAGCERCRMTGFRGRGGIFETLPVTEAIESLVTMQRPASEIKKQAIAEGMQTLREDGWQKVLAGFTTINEVLRVTEDG